MGRTMAKQHKRFLTWMVCLGLVLSGWSAAADDTSGALKADVDIPNAKMPAPGLLVGGQPSPEQLKQAVELGYGTVINLRGLGEAEDRDEAKEAAELGLDYIAVPITGAQDLTRENVSAFADALKKAEGKPMLVHCASGNRVGALFALKAFWIDQKSAEDAKKIGEQHGLRSLAPAVEKLMNEGRP